MSKLRKKILVVAQTPPPMHGQAIMNRYLLEGSFQDIDLHHVRMAFSEEISEVGGFRWRKLFHLFTLILQITLARLGLRTTILYYPPASPNMVPFLRDCVILIATRWMFQRTVFHFHANGISELFENFPAPLKVLYRLAYSRPDVCICLTKSATDDARHFGAIRVEIVPNGIPDVVPDLDCKDKTSERLPVILFLATVSLEKGAGILIEAVGSLIAKGIRFRCIAAGPFASKDDENALRLLSSKIGLNGDIIWCGSLSGESKWRAFREADIFCFPSHYRTEGLPVVLLEAMMFGLPIVSTKWRGIPDVVQDGQTGFLVPIKDVQAVTRRLEQLIKDPTLRKSMGNAARRSFEENFTVEKFQRRIGEVLASV